MRCTVQWTGDACRRRRRQATLCGAAAVLAAVALLLPADGRSAASPHDVVVAARGLVLRPAGVRVRLTVTKRRSDFPARGRASVRLSLAARRGAGWRSLASVHVGTFAWNSRLVTFDLDPAPNQATLTLRWRVPGAGLVSFHYLVTSGALDAAG